MSGVNLVGYLLRSFESLTAVVPQASMSAMLVPAKTVPPAISAKRISRVETQMLARQQWRHVRERVQVTVEANSYRDLVAILKLVVSACSDQIIASHEDIERIAVLSAGGGPDFLDEGGTIFMGSHDFYVDYDEPA